MIKKKSISTCAPHRSGHARNTAAHLRDILEHKWAMMGALAASSDGGGAALAARFDGLRHKSSDEVAAMHSFEITPRDDYVDA